MKTGTYVAGMVGAGIVGGIVGAWFFLTFFADDLRPAAPAPTVSVAEGQFSDAEAAALRRIPNRLDELESGLEAMRKERRAAPLPPAPGAAPGTAVPAFPVAIPLEHQMRSNETAAIATLRNLATCQAQIQTTGKVDCDRDGIGEFGTLQEMSGAVGVRKSVEGQDRGNPIQPAILAPAFQTVDGDGRVVRNGYVYQLFLPDNQTQAGWVHESAGGGFAGGSSVVGTDLAETTWCMYAWPVEQGKTGSRAFFINQSGDVLQTSNDRKRHEGTSTFDPSSAFRGSGITSMIAVGTSGNDGNVWKVSN